MERQSHDIQVRPIGHIVGGREENIDDDWGAVSCHIALDPTQLDESATAGLEAFSHVEIVFVFDRVFPGQICRGSRHPRGRTDWPEVGILAQRAKDRPNRIGVTVCELRNVRGLALEVVGLDAVDGTPILDVKPYFSEFGPRGETREPQWARELMSSYW